MSAIENIPVVDFSSILAASSADMKTLPAMEELRLAISGIGFVFLKNHGIDRKQVSVHCMMNSHVALVAVKAACIIIQKQTMPYFY